MIEVERPPKNKWVFSEAIHLPPSKMVRRGLLFYDAVRVWNQMFNFGSWGDRVCGSGGPPLGTPQDLEVPPLEAGFWPF